MKDITEIFISLLNECGSLDIAESEFKRIIADDENLRTQYNDWCRERGCTYRNGFTDFCEEYLDSKNSVWDYLTDHDE